ncbi:MULTISPECIES: dicarboxylate/amino acid:cation symporter [unclassified Treponema]|uniref:dicarboxylate/amino acid:cation symporter n=1 Tax=unclassified Treponema TaxID=2638727 RepID=UPI0020A42D9F|nr:MULTISPECIES: cation:dicarboxylase symporter family transporter [unclassified Treponema]UTC65920.1 dicarboxylate/amino acid:cation symporter [Treponema sp. OMZ 789]UTC68648.1 dicarboxylate/amino acid:cation symporter [Treponema sp. OMZ 790]UTC71378.1 dicarboxylate/amino acid:cation symporter [Treponema sp. OMZ 791]
MKIWIKYLIGSALGIIIAVLTSSDSGFFNSAVEFASNIAVQFGRYSLYPVLFFGFTVSISKLRESRSLLKLSIYIAAFIVLSSLLAALLGLLSISISSPPRIPIFVEETSAVENLGVMESFLRLLPSSAFEAFMDGLYILPLCIFAGFAGAACAVDKNISKPVLTLFDSLSRVSYAVMAFFVDMFSIGLIAVSVNWFIKFQNMLSTKFFTGFVVLLLVDFFIIALVIYPAILKIICRDINPYKILYASIAPVCAAFFSGDTNLTLPILLRHSNESLGVRRRISSVSLPVFSVFGRAGSAMVVTISFIVILKSYSSLGISLEDRFWLVGVSTLFSFFLGRFPITGTYVSLVAVCAIYGRGFESGFLILRPAAFFIGAVAAAIDALTAMVGTYIIGHLSKMTNTRNLRFFI